MIEGGGAIIPRGTSTPVVVDLEEEEEEEATTMPSSLAGSVRPRSDLSSLPSATSHIVLRLPILVVPGKI